LLILPLWLPQNLQGQQADRHLLLGEGFAACSWQRATLLEHVSHRSRIDIHNRKMCPAIKIKNILRGYQFSSSIPCIASSTWSLAD
jgi:hypothetical protein